MKLNNNEVKQPIDYSSMPLQINKRIETKIKRKKERFLLVRVLKQENAFII